jgi:apolipoprotein D and lipocalin family protein
MRRPWKLLAALLATAAVASWTLAATATAQAAPPVQTVDNVDLQRYQGDWLQLAAIPQFFLADCARDVKARYAIQPDGLVRVDNSCVRRDGSTKAIEGRARVRGATTNAKLQVTFLRFGANRWLFLPGGAYWIIGLDRDYRWAVVGDPFRFSGFILSRTPTLPQADVRRIARVLKRNGYDPARFEPTPQSGG